MTNKTNFNGWSGKTEFTKLDITKLNLSGSTRSMSIASSPIIEGPVNLVKTPKNGPSRVKVSVPVYKTGETQTQTVTNTRSLSLPQELNLPFTAGTVDYSFPAGGGYTIDGFDGPVFDVKVDSNGKYLVGGDFGKYYYNGNQTYSPYLIRLNSDGTVDDTFNITFNSDCYGGGFDGTIYSVEIQPDGKILVGGAFRTFDRDLNCNTSNRIIRLNSDGSKDLTFNIGDGFNDEVYDIQVQPNGKILVGGYFTQYNNIDAYHIIRLNSNGSIDSSFLIGNSDVSFNDYVNTIKLQSDGKILVGGWFTTYGFNSQNYISRLNTDGTIDLTFQIGNGFNDEVNTIALQSDGKIIVGGYFNSFDNNDLFNGRIVRLDSNGTLDTLFGYGLDDSIQSISIQSDGKIIVGGYFTKYYINNNDRIGVNRLVRFHSDCSFDYSFYYDELFSDGIECITILEDNNILVGGYFGNADPEIYPLNYFGRLHNSISVYPYSYTVLACAQPLVDERTTYVIGSMVPLEFESTHSFQSINNPSVTVCGYIDYTYPSNVIEYFEVSEYRDCGEAYIDNYKLVTVEDCLSPYYDQFLPVWVVDKKYEIGDILYIDLVLDGEGRFFNKFAATITIIDLEWNVPFPIWDYLPPINYAPYSSCEDAINANGLHYVAVSCTEMEETFPLIHKPYYDSISLLSPTGSNPVKILVDYLPYAPYEYISNGTPEIYSTVEFGTYNDNYNTLCGLGLASVSPEGVLNQSFANTGFDGSLVYTMVEQPDGKILVGGNFNQYLEVNVGNFMRINPDGTLDETFYLGQFDSYIRAIALQPDGKILVGGNFTNYDGYNAGRIIRLNSDGTIDRNFTYSSEFNNTVRAIAIQRDGKIVVGGDFNYYYDFYCPQIVRLNSNGTPDRTFVMGDGFDGDQVFTISLNPIRVDNSGSGNIPVRYIEEIIVGGRFTWYNGSTVRGIVKLSPTGEVLPDFGEGFNVDNGNTPRVNQILTQPDGKLIIIGGATDNGSQLLDYNSNWIPQNIVRLQNISGRYIIDTTFTTRFFDDTGGFNNGVTSATLLPNGKIMVGGQFNYYGDNQNIHIDIPYLVRLNSDGILDETFTFDLYDDNVNKVLLLSSGRLLVGGRFNSPYDRLLELFIGEEYKLRSFDTCDGLTSNIFVPTNFQPKTLLDLVYDGDFDDDNFSIELPLGFDVNFLGTNYTSVYIGSNAYLTFGSGSDNHDFSIPDQIDSDGPGLPGVYISTRQYLDGSTSCMDSAMWKLYTGTTDNGNTTIVRFEGNDDFQADQGDTNLVYNFKFYKDQSDYFDLIIEQNVYFCNDDSTGGTSEGGNLFIDSFDSSSGNSYRIDSNGDITTLIYSPLNITLPIKANVNDRVAVCGSVGDIITTPQLNDGSGIGGSMYFDGTTDTMVTVNNGSGQFGFGGTNDFTIEWFQLWEGGSGARPFSINTYPNEYLAVSYESSIYLWVASSGYNTGVDPTELLDGWHHIALTRNYNGNENVTYWRFFIDGVNRYQFTTLGNDPNIANTDNFIIGNSSGNDQPFKGYITNFRATNLTALYVNNFDVPPCPLTPDQYTILLMLSTNNNNLITDSSFVGQNITQNNVIWSSSSPCSSPYNFSLFTATNYKNYYSCTDCDSTTKLNVIAYERGNNTPDRVVNLKLTKEFINDILTKGPIWTFGPYPYCYELLKYYK